MADLPTHHPLLSLAVRLCPWHERVSGKHGSEKSCIGGKQGTKEATVVTSGGTERENRGIGCGVSGQPPEQTPGHARTPPSGPATPAASGCPAWESGHAGWKIITRAMSPPPLPASVTHRSLLPRPLFTQESRPALGLRACQQPTAEHTRHPAATFLPLPVPRSGPAGFALSET